LLKQKSSAFLFSKLLQKCLSILDMIVFKSPQRPFKTANLF
jgi:hypothetical protein